MCRERARVYACADARFHFPCGVAVLPDGSLAVADSGNGAVRWILPSVGVTTIYSSGKAQPQQPPSRVGGGRAETKGGSGQQHGQQHAPVAPPTPPPNNDDVKGKEVARLLEDNTRLVAENERMSAMLRRCLSTLEALQQRQAAKLDHC